MRHTVLQKVSQIFKVVTEKDLPIAEVFVWANDAIVGAVTNR